MNIIQLGKSIWTIIWRLCSVFGWKKSFLNKVHTNLVKLEKADDPTAIRCTIVCRTFFFSKENKFQLHMLNGKPKTFGKFRKFELPVAVLPPRFEYSNWFEQLSKANFRLLFCASTQSAISTFPVNVQQTMRVIKAIVHYRRIAFRTQKLSHKVNQKTTMSRMV